MKTKYDNDEYFLGGKGKVSFVGDNDIRVGGTVSWRSNNPGNIIWSKGGFAQDNGAIGYIVIEHKNRQDEKIAVFPNYEAGRQAQIKLLKNYAASHPEMTILQLANRWTSGHIESHNEILNVAPKHIISYATGLANTANVNIDAKLSSLSRIQLEKMQLVQQKHEGFLAGDSYNSLK